MSVPPRILALTTMRNEGPFIIEWIAHGRVVGITDFLVFSNDCDDGTTEVLDRFMEAGVLTHVRQKSGGKSVQWSALRAAREHPSFGAADWVTCIDCDEFIVPTGAAGDLAGLIAAAEADAILLPWRLFGSSGHLRFEDRPVTERFTRAAPARIPFPAAARFFKTLWRREAFRQPGVHRPKARKGRPARWVDGSGDPLPESFATDDTRILLPGAEIACARVQLNHYSLRSAEDFLVKRHRGLPNRKSKPVDATYWAERNFNTVEDKSIFRFAGPVAAECERLFDVPGVRAAHASAVQLYREKIAALLRDPDEARLFTRLALLRDSVPPDDETSRALAMIIARAVAHGPGK